jgi:hypothetical protein
MAFTSWTGNKANLAADAADEAMSRLLHENLYENSPVWMLATNMGDVSGSGAASLQTATLTRGAAAAAAIADENTAATVGTITLGNFTAAVAVQEYRIDQTDLMRVLQGSGVNIPLAVSLCVDAINQRRTDLFTTTFTGLATTKGTTGTDFDVDALWEAIYASQIAFNSANGGALILKPKALGEFQASLRTEGGSAQFSPATAAMLQMKGQMFAGTYAGVSVFSCGSVTDDATDYSNALVFPGAFGYVEADLSALNGDGAVNVPSGSSVRVEIERDAAKAQTAIIARDAVGFAEQEDLRAVEILSQVA